MHLLLRRSQRDDGWLSSSMMFLLDARLELTPDEHALLGDHDRYDILNIIVYDSDARTEYDNKAYEHAQSAAEGPHFSTDLLTALQYSISTLWSAASSVTNSALAAFSLRTSLPESLRVCHEIKGAGILRLRAGA